MRIPKFPKGLKRRAAKALRKEAQLKKKADRLKEIAKLKAIVERVAKK